MSSGDEITQLIHNLRGGDHDAAQQLWDAYYRRLVTVARKKLAGLGRAIDDEEDVALSAFKSFCRGMDQGKFANVADRNELWSLLITITTRKAFHVARDAKRLKRGGGQTFVDDNRSGSRFVDRVPGEEPDPAHASEIGEEFERLLSLLPTADLVELVTLKLEGFTNEEIARRWNKAERTIERKLKLVRQIWGSELEGEDDAAGM